MPDARKRFISVALTMCAFAATFVVAVHSFGRPVIRVALLNGKSARYLQKALESWGDTRGETVRAVALGYDDLRDAVTHPSRISGFDVIMVDDPWIADLVERDQIRQVPVGSFAETLSKFVPEFLRVCYYRKGGGVSRRPDLTQIAPDPNATTLDSERLQAVSREYGLYALPFIGNAQVLVASANSSLGEPPSWPDIAKSLKVSKATFFTRLGSNNSALVDFLPILWASGGCLVGMDGGREVSGFSSDGHTRAAQAFELSMALAAGSSVQYTRFKDEEVFQYLAASDNAVGVSWLAYRIQPDRGDGPLRWFRMPDSEPEAKASPICKKDVERVTRGDTPRTGAFGLWSLAVPTASENPELGWVFIHWALEKLRNKEPPKEDGPCGDSRALTASADVPSPFEDRLPCSIRTLIRHSRPRSADPDWHEIEAAVGFRIRQAHWKTLEIPEAVAWASKDLEEILKRRQEGGAKRPPPQGLSALFARLGP